MTNSERVVTLCSQFRYRPGEAKPDWEIFAEVGRCLGFTKEFNFASSEEVYAEFVQLTRDRPCDVSGLSYERLRKEGPTQWPCPDEEETIGESPSQPDSAGIFSSLFADKEEKPQPKRLYTDGRFNTADGRAKFAAFHSKGLAEPSDEEYPLVLTTGRLYEHWHTMTRTGRIERIMKKQPQPFIEIHPRDAEKLNIAENELVEVRSRRGLACFPARITKAISPGTVFVPMHWGSLWTDNGEANLLTHPESCPVSHQPELKACAVRLIPAKKRVESETMTITEKSTEKSPSFVEPVIKQSVSV